MTQTEWTKVWAWFVTTESGFKIFAEVERRRIVLGPIGGIESGPQVHYVFRDRSPVEISRKSDNISNWPVSGHPKTPAPMTEQSHETIWLQESDWKHYNDAVDKARAWDAIMKARADEREACARIAEHGCLVPPDGGSPTVEEKEMCDGIARAIRARSFPPGSGVVKL